MELLLSDMCSHQTSIFFKESLLLIEYGATAIAVIILRLFSENKSRCYKYLCFTVFPFYAKTPKLK